MDFRAIKAPPVNGKPAWYGQYRIGALRPWRTVRSQYGCIVYTSVGYALAGARFTAAE